MNDARLPPSPAASQQGSHPARRRTGGGVTHRSTGANSGLLHNMSVPPRKVIVHHDRRGRLGGPGWIVRGALLPNPLTLQTVLWLFTRDEVPEAERAGRLRQEILAYAAEGGLPEVALVSQQQSEFDWEFHDLRASICVLTQASSHVYLRDKEPNLSYLQRDRELVLLVDPRKFTECPLLS